MQQPAWLNKIIGLAVLASVVLAAKGIGWLCRRFLALRAACIVAVPIGGVTGFGIGAGYAYWEFPPAAREVFVPFFGGFCALVGAIQSGLSAGGVGGQSKIGVGD